MCHRNIGKRDQLTIIGNWQYITLMPQHFTLSFIICIVLAGCGGSGVTVNKGTTLPYLAETFQKSKNWFRSTDGQPTNPNGPPPPTPFLPTSNSQKNSPPYKEETQKTSRMGKQDYSTAINRLQESIPELEKEYGKGSMEVGETHYTIGAMHAMQKQKQRARMHFEKVIPIFSKWLGKEHPRVWKINRQLERLK